MSQFPRNTSRIPNYVLEYFHWKMTPAETAAFCMRCLNRVCVLGGLIRICIILNLKQIWEELESHKFCSEGVLVPVSPQNCPKGRTKE